MTIRLNQKILDGVRSGKRYVVFYGGRGSGKSWGTAISLVLEVLEFEARFGPTRVLCAKEYQNSLADSTLSQIKRVISAYGLDDLFVPTKYGISTINGTEFIFRGLQFPDRIKSYEGLQFVWVEEATKVSRDAWEVLGPTVREEGSRIYVTFNPDEDDDPTYQMFVANDHPEAYVARLNYYDNEFLTSPLRREMEIMRDSDEERYQHVWLGETVHITDDLVLGGKFQIHRFESPDPEKQAKANQEITIFRGGADFGFSQDPVVLLRSFIKDHRIYVDYEAYGVGVELSEIPELFDSVPGARDIVIVGDSSRPDIISMLNRQRPRFHIKASRKGPGSIKEGIDFLRDRTVIIHPRCENTAFEARNYRYKRDKLTGDVLPVIIDKHNHCIDALRYSNERIMLKGRQGKVDINSRIA